MIKPYRFACPLLATSGKQYVWHVATFGEIVQKWEELKTTTDLRLVGIASHYESPTNHCFIGTWNEIGGFAHLCRTPEWKTFASDFARLQNTTRLLDFDIKLFEGQLYFIGSWGGQPVKQVVVHDVSQDEFVATWRTLSTRESSMRLIKIQAFRSPNPSEPYRLTGLFEAGSGAYGLYICSDWLEFMRQTSVWMESMQMTDFEVFEASNGKNYYIGVYRESSKDRYLLWGFTWNEFANALSSLCPMGLVCQKIVWYVENDPLVDPGRILSVGSFKALKNRAIAYGGQGAAQVATAGSSTQASLQNAYQALNAMSIVSGFGG